MTRSRIAWGPGKSIILTIALWIVSSLSTSLAGASGTVPGGTTHDVAARGSAQQPKQAAARGAHQNARGPAPDLRTLSESIARFEALYDRYLDHDPRQAAMDSLNSFVAVFNRDLDATNRAEAGDHAAIEERARSLDSLKFEVASLEAAIQTRPSAADGAAIQAYNEKVSRYNERAEEYRKRVAEHNERVEEFNRESASRKATMDRRRSGIETERSRFDALIAGYASWFQSGGDQQMGKDFKAFFAQVRQGQRANTSDPRWNDLLARVRAMRRKLAAYAIRSEEKADEGVLIVEAEIADETCWLVLDTGATRMSVSPELVAALGIESARGDEIVSGVAGGANTRGHSLILPRVRVGDAVVTDVPAIELPETMLGVDGLLGRSFLRRFDLTIGSGRDPEVTLANPR